MNKKLFAVATILLALFLSGCANMQLTTMDIEAAKVRYAGAVEIDPHSTTVKVQWVTKGKELEYFCGRLAAACTNSMGMMHFIYAVKPRDWNDEYALMLLGHELLHAAGADHKK